ncbi:phosphomethylpyrimidine kinase [Cryptococcus sp. DSM 104549]
MATSSSSSLEPKRRPHVMTIAGSDSGGGAGIQADLKTFEAFGCYGSSVLTGLTAQNTLGVQGVHVVPTDFVIQQFESVVKDDPPKAIKIGMLTSASTITALSRALPSSQATIVLDPVMISTSGRTLLPDEAITALVQDLFPLVNYLTPNIPEASRLSDWQGKEVQTLDEMVELAKRTHAATRAEKVLLKGGHATIQRDEVLRYKGEFPIVWEEGDEEDETVEIIVGYKASLGQRVDAKKDLVVDILVDQGEVKAMFVGNKVESQSTHGTGCTLSSAIACAYATAEDPRGGKSDVEIFKRAIAYTQSSIAAAFPFGHGHGPLNHGHLTALRALPPPTKQNPHPFLTHLIQSDMPLWKSYIRHPFVVQLGKGTLPEKCFVHYTTQGYQYITHYARAHALGAYKADNFEDIEAFGRMALQIAKDSSANLAFCEQFNISPEQLRSTPMSANSSAYARYMLDIGAQGDILDLYMATASCLIGYGEVGLWLKRQVGRGEAILEGNPYRRWMEDYGGEEFLGLVNQGIENLEKRVARDPPTPQKLAKLTKIWHDCLRFERGFWDMGLNLL